MERPVPNGFPKLIVAAVVIVAVVATASLLAGRHLDREELSRIVEELHAFGHHWWAPIVLIGAFIVVNLTGLPGTPLTLTAGAVWGWGLGSWWAIVATMIGTAFPYMIARHGAPRIQRILDERFGDTHELLRREGMTAVFLLRVVHVFPFAVISYGSGFARIRPIHYVLGTLFGTLPGVLVYTYLADAILEGAVSSRQAMGRILLGGLLLTALVIGTRMLARRVKGRVKSEG